MKIVAIGDLHGRSIWKQIVSDNPDADLFVFIGDYFDSFDIKGEDQINNFKDIWQYKLDNLTKVVLLIGNHDLHYLEIGEVYGGFQRGYQYEIRKLLRDAINTGLIQACLVHKNLLFTHAGVSTTWMTNVISEAEEILTACSFQDNLNDLLTFIPRAFRVQSVDKEGDSISEGPMWIRPYSLSCDYLEGYIHIVGHTPQDKLIIGENIVLIDTLGTSREYLVIEDGKFIVKKV